MLVERVTANWQARFLPLINSVAGFGHLILAMIMTKDALDNHMRILRTTRLLHDCLRKYFSFMRESAATSNYHKHAARNF
jgi:hypothetical protein